MGIGRDLGRKKKKQVVIKTVQCDSLNRYSRQPDCFFHSTVNVI